MTARKTYPFNLFDLIYDHLLINHDIENNDIDEVYYSREGTNNRCLYFTSDINESEEEYVEIVKALRYYNILVEHWAESNYKHYTELDEMRINWYTDIWYKRH